MGQSKVPKIFSSVHFSTNPSWFKVSLTSLLPFIILSFLNFAIWRRLNFLREVTRKVAMMMRMTMIMVTHKVAMPNNVQESKSSLSSSAILICTVSMFLVCHLPRCHLVCHLPPCLPPATLLPPAICPGSSSPATRES